MEKTTIGIIFALTSTAAWATCTLAFKKFGERLEPIAMTLIKASLSVFFLAILMFLTNTSFKIDIDFLLKIFLSGLLGITIGDSLFFASLNKLSPIVLSLILFAGPDIFTGIFGIIFLGENPSLLVWLGIVITMFGLSFFIFSKNQADKNSQTSTIGIILALSSLICTSYSMVLIKPVLVQNSTLTVTMYRMLFSAITLLLYSIFSKKFLIWKKSLNDRNYNIKLSLTIMLASYGGFWLSLSAIKYCDLIVASTLMSLEPLFIFIFSILFCQHIPSKDEIKGVCISILGIVIISIG